MTTEGAGEDTGSGLCVLVTGAPRSGTSAMSGMLVNLGLALAQGVEEDDIFPPNQFNPKGIFESRALSTVNDTLLRIVNGSFLAPPLLAPGWVDQEQVREQLPGAIQVAADALPRGPCVWKDPRNCLTMAFWRRVLAFRPVAAIHIWRHPLGTAASLSRLGGFAITRGLTLWEEYNRAALQELAGLPVLVTSYEHALSDPAWISANVGRFLASSGVAVKATATDQGSLSGADAGVSASTDAGVTASTTVSEQRNWWDSALDHNPHPDPGILLPSQLRLMAILDGMEGIHAKWDPPELGNRDAWSEGMLEAIRAYELTLQSSLRSMRVAKDALQKMENQLRSVTEALAAQNLLR